MKHLKEGATEHLSLGSSFGMSMKLGVPYSMTNTVIEYEQDKRIAWQTVLSGPLGRFIGGRIWRYELEAADGGTRVRESWDITQDKQRFMLQVGPVGKQTAEAMTKTLGRLAEITETPGLERRMTDAIDAAWEERILPALSEYTRIPCLSPAYDPDWAERGAIAAAAELLREWVRDQDDAFARPRSSNCPGAPRCCSWTMAAPANPMVVYGHMDKQPPLGEWRAGSAPTSRCARATCSTGEARPTTATRRSPP